MANLIFSLKAFKAAGGEQKDLDDLMARVVSRTWFDLATPDPKFSGFTVEDEDQLPGRPLEGKIEIAAFFASLQLLVTDAQQNGPVNGESIFSHHKRTNALVLGPNVGQFLYENQHLIPVELRGKVILVFWGKVYRNSGRSRYVRCLYWRGKRWVWDYDWLGRLLVCRLPRGGAREEVLGSRNLCADLRLDPLSFVQFRARYGSRGRSAVQCCAADLLIGFW